MKYKVSSAVYAGTRHQRELVPCQDCVHIVRDCPVLCCALSDGAGSCANSRQGAECVTAVVTEVLCHEFECIWEMEPDEEAQFVIQQCYTALAAQEPPIHEMACTLLFCACHQDGRFLSGHLGDGVMVLEQADILSVFSYPENGEYQNETYFITGEQAEKHLRLRRGIWSKEGTLLLMSDGTADSLFEYATRKPAAACRTLAAWLRDGDEAVIDAVLLKNMEKKFTAHTTDDMSLILISCQREAKTES